MPASLPLIEIPLTDTLLPIPRLISKTRSGISRCHAVTTILSVVRVTVSAGRRVIFLINPIRRHRQVAGAVMFAVVPGRSVNQDVVDGITAG